MNYIIYCVYDRCIGNYSRIFVEQTEESMKRNFKILLANPQNPFKGIESDLDIYCIGNWNIENGQITSSTPIKCCSVSSLLKK